ncbi:MAG: hypothetical protein Hyperionvirus22_29 [Hyperionvirus sp.]|uniref:Uncharacterized protein n=1 Tax=Hyperionvirus sp. TaxID=2487770 RepID=A0A3G5AAR6_9VIRU|nr:MAG: hypothetical protein Hyperionvirus22_29 [Hyperionvirus sp.]
MGVYCCSRNCFLTCDRTIKVIETRRKYMMMIMINSVVLMGWSS